MKNLIYCANIHSGGALQVAGSFVYEICKKDFKGSLSIWVSTEIHEALKLRGIELLEYDFVTVINSSFKSILSFKHTWKLLRFNKVFVVFGPLYSFFPPENTVVGFAQPWIVYPCNEVYKGYSLFDKFSTKLKYKIQKFFYLKSKEFIVELPHVKEQLSLLHGVCESKIHVVNNCLSDVFFDEKKWKAIDFPIESGNFKVGFLGRNYSHKNVNYILNVKDYLLDNFGVHIDIYVTFTDAELQLCSSHFQQSVRNLGQLSANQCPTFFNFIDLLVFPSLLECFSATPIEAMFMKTPLVVSDRVFNRDVCSDFAFYINPEIPSECALIIKELFIDNPRDNESELDNAKMHSHKFSQPSRRAEKYIQILHNL
jgi:glycosyltransferase involved in cell wall biosynthesis